MAVPEAPMDKNGRPEFRENHVWRSRQMPSVQAETESLSMQHASEKQLGFRVFCTNPRHHPAAGFYIDNIRHRWRVMP